MSKQSEIREGIVVVFREFRLNTRLDREPDAYQYADELLKKLDSQGVVLKVDRELPAYTPRDESNNLVRLGFGMARRDMLEAGYGAFESIIPSNQH